LIAVFLYFDKCKRTNLVTQKKLTNLLEKFNLENFNLIRIFWGICALLFPTRECNSLTYFILATNFFQTSLKLSFEFLGKYDQSSIHVYITPPNIS